MDDKEKDLFIKNELQKDDLISKKADDLFNDFLSGKIEVNSEKEKVVELNQKIKQTIPLRKRLLSMAASLVIVFLAANVYAATKGYNNIFFIIRDLFVEEDVHATKEEILVDKDITISYKDIEIADGLFIQINSLVIENNDARLYLTVTENDSLVRPGRYVVKDSTNGKELLADQVAERKKSISKDTISYVQTINLKGVKDNTNILSLEIFDENEESISLMDIDLANKQINVLTGKSRGEVQKLSETELKSVLGDFASLIIVDDIDEKDKEFEARKLLLLTSIIDRNGNDLSKDNIIKAYKELTGEEISSPKELVGKDSFMFYDEKNEELKNGLEGRDGFISCLVLTIKDLNYENGIYSADIIFIAPSEEDYIDNKLEELNQYETTIKFKLNPVYDFTRYQIVNANSLKYKLYSGNELVNVVNNTISENTINNSINNNTVSNTTTNSISNTVNNTTTKTNTVKDEGVLKTISFGQRADLVDGMHVTVQKLVLKEKNKATLYMNVLEEDKVAQNKRIKNVSISYSSPTLGVTTINKSISTNMAEQNIECELGEFADDISTVTISLDCDKGLISKIALDLKTGDLNVIYANDLLNVDDVTGLENEIKNVAARYILMNYYKDVDGNNSIEAKREMMLYTAFLLDEDGMTRNYGSETRLTNIGESIVYSIIKGYAKTTFDSTTKFTENFMTREEGSNGMEGSIRYISGNRYNLEANIKSVENFEKLGSFNYRMTFTYSYNLKPTNTYRATIDLRTYDFDSSNPIAKQFVQYQLVNSEIQSEKVK